MSLGILAAVVVTANQVGFVGDGISTVRDLDLTGYIELSGIRPKIPTAAFITAAAPSGTISFGGTAIAYTLSLVGAVLTFTFASAPALGSQGFVEQIVLAF